MSLQISSCPFCISDSPSSSFFFFTFVQNKEHGAFAGDLGIGFLARKPVIEKNKYPFFNLEMN